MAASPVITPEEELAEKKILKAREPEPRPKPVRPKQNARTMLEDIFEGYEEFFGLDS